ncbi:MAG: hypothetical protein K0M70_06615 [Arenimonas sp.]|uniref:hypothetical protein n=1 Tax=Arenimonas sp. TaxID=1872635 RepID=UPI0025C6165E|nr:hypothetical protein [Arenimonas sp.]MBW8367515.1 hypothetical protein [Arenimonas sp.]
MPRLPARTLRFLRLSALMLLVLSIMARPVVEQVGGIHEVEHAVLAAADADHGHDHAGHDPASDPDHTKGFHGLMHQAECGATAALGSSWAVALAIPPADAPPRPGAAAPRLGIPATPFRPPIA